MEVELIPVLEFSYEDQGIPTPDRYPYWENSEAWDKYRNQCYSKAGFKDKLTPYLAGSPFFRVSEISRDSLSKVVKDHTKDFRNGAYDRQEMSALYGGYVLRVNDLNKFFPQCCGDLADMFFWEALANGQQSYYEGHPVPKIETSVKCLTLDFSVNEFDEPFQPTPPERKLEINLEALKEAVTKAKIELREFAEILNEINQEEHLGIQNIEGLLIWENANHN